MIRAEEKVEILGLGMGAAQVWLLFMLRTLGFVAVVPLFSARAAPPTFRIALTFLLTTIAFIAWMPRAQLPDTTLASFIPAGVSELVLGLMLGFMTGMVFVAFQYAGQFIGYQMGFAIVNVFDPQTQNQVSLIGEFLFAIVILCFLDLNLHHDFLYLWFQSYDIAPPGVFSLDQYSLTGILAMCNDLMILALKIAVPLLSFLMLTDLSLGIIARVMPQMNVFIVGIPLKIAMGLIFLSLVVLQFDPLVRHVTMEFINDAGLLLRDLVS